MSGYINRGQQPVGYAPIPYHAGMHQGQPIMYAQGAALAAAPQPLATGFHSHIGNNYQLAHQQQAHRQQLLSQPLLQVERPKPSSANHPVNIKWIKDVAVGTVGLDGTALATCVDESQLPAFLTIPMHVRNILEVGGSATLTQKKTTAANEVVTFIKWLRNAIHAEIEARAQQLREGGEVISAAKRHSELFVNLAAAVFVLKVARQLQPLVEAGETTKNAHVFHAKVPKKGSIVDHTDLTIVLDGCTVETRVTYLKALLAAFDCLQEEHMRRRDMRMCKGFPGWDTAVVISLTHVVQNVAKTIEVLEDDVMGNVLRNWRKLFVFLQTSDTDVPNEASRRRGALAVANSLLILLFQHDNTHQCRILLKTIEAAEKSAEAQKDTLKSIVASSSHLVAEMVKFRYFQGRMRLYDRNFSGALACFSEASRLLPKIPVGESLLEIKQAESDNKVANSRPAAPEGSDHSLAWGTVSGGKLTAPNLAAPIPKGMNEAQRDNKLRVVFYQIVSAILVGLRVPPEVLLTDPSSAKVLSPVIAAIESGSPAGFSMALEHGGAYLRLRGVSMVLQQALIYTYLTALQLVHAAITNSGKDISMLPIPLFVEVINASNSACCDAKSPSYLFAGAASEVDASSEPLEHPDVARLTKKLRSEAVASPCDVDSAILWIGRLISKGFVRGYLSYEHKMLVLSKKEPFPIPQYEFSLA